MILKALLAAVLLSATTWIGEVEPNDPMPNQRVGFDELRLKGQLAPDDTDRFLAGLGFQYPFVTLWLGSLQLTGEPGKWLTLDVYEWVWWWPFREHIAHGEGWGEVEVVFLHAHDPKHPWRQEIVIGGEAQRWKLEGPPYLK